MSISGHRSLLWTAVVLIGATVSFAVIGPVRLLTSDLMGNSPDSRMAVLSKKVGQEKDPGYAYVVIDIMSVHPATCSIGTQISLSLSDFDRDQLLDQNNQVARIGVDRPETPAHYRLSIHHPFYGDPVEVQIPFALRPDPVAADIPTNCNAQAFPLDRHDLSLYVRLELPDDVVWRHQSTSTQQIPVGVALTTNSNLADWITGSATSLSEIDDLGGHTAFLSDSVERPLDYTLFILAVTLAPLLLGWAAFVRWRQSGSAVSLELAVALIALFPVRQVLVPSDIPGLTWLDRLLGFELVLIAGSFAYLVSQTSSSALPSALPQQERQAPRHVVHKLDHGQSEPDPRHNPEL